MRTEEWEDGGTTNFAKGTNGGMIEEEDEDEEEEEEEEDDLGIWGAIGDCGGVGKWVGWGDE